MTHSPWRATGSGKAFVGDAPFIVIAALRARLGRRRAFRSRGLARERREVPILPCMATMVEPLCLMAISVSGAWPFREERLGSSHEGPAA